MSGFDNKFQFHSRQNCGIIFFHDHIISMLFEIRFKLLRQKYDKFL